MFARIARKTITTAAQRVSLHTRHTVVDPEVLSRARKISPPIGFTAGIFGSLVGVGGGVVIVPLIVSRCQNIPQKLVSGTSLPPGNQATVLGTSLLSMVLPSSAALVQHARLGNVDWRMAAGLALGTGVGGTLGIMVAVETPSGVLEAIFGVGMLFLGRKTLQTAK